MSGKTVLVILITAVVTATLVLFVTQNTREQPLSADEHASGAVDSSLPSGEAPLLEPLPVEGEKEIRITKAMVDAMLLGVTVEEVEDSWGRISDEMESEHHSGIQGYTSPYSVLWHSWNNSDGTRVKLGFIDKKLDRKYFYYRDGNFSTSEVDLEALAEEKTGSRQ